MEIAFKNSFFKEVKKIADQSLKDSISKSIFDAEEANLLSDIKNIKKLAGYSNYYRIRIGNYRIGLKWIQNEGKLYFVTFDHRRNIYKKFP